MSEQKLAGTVRTEFGKGAARKARVDNMIPAVIYGHGADVLHILLPAKATTLAVRTANALLEIDVDGESHLALAKDIQRDPIKQIIEHIDLLTVRKGEKVEVEVNVHVEGELAPGSSVYNQEANTVLVAADATNLPETIVVSIEGRVAGEHIYASDLELPAGVELLLDPETMVINISESTVQDLGAPSDEQVAIAAAEVGAEA
ncbi:50S ribosomal protein L25/general stress protein Ctc [Arthrobacter sp. zg-Y820]|uniref:50S ribosomal protein L25/general stress protein Ctc n=1 Tax=unclassified Arthrobacter TaxID=235627 RepID=UPI001E431783|nr:MULTISPECIES: 50S ribosomal protein L25/general stress protein Ctc [unclassified Arthrobacter]MCC9197981.1 50S ribosomal protein L25/general stress protein Ctc [Arthrobacter sp. zg-Y820]MDK1280848.1 50S ribosomal protein L25/general stress protein Ctc [Arthrobacter sp. zg.Y820]MDK1360154.1 50S ribosomal protein L25/general stress protein Ctc [Arthrobacter sp. zg-Y1219]WIB10327.1 50S ribosomal protein L25/general stress protein Ctc [Arthrobacter sp. zg-Y820]